MGTPSNGSGGGPDLPLGMLEVMKGSTQLTAAINMALSMFTFSFHFLQ